VARTPSPRVFTFRPRKRSISAPATLGSARVQDHIQFTASFSIFTLANLVPQAKKAFVTSLTVTNRDSTDAEVRFLSADSLTGPTCTGVTASERIAGTDETDITAKAGTRSTSRIRSLYSFQTAELPPDHGAS
jgi:hypothetical protein